MDDVVGARTGDDVEDDAKRFLQQILDEYSGFHDGDLVEFSIRPAERTATCAVRAEHFLSGEVRLAILRFVGVRTAKMLPAKHASFGFEDFFFPANAEIDGVEVALVDAGVTVQINGIYGWLIEIASSAVSVSFG